MRSVTVLLPFSHSLCVSAPIVSRRFDLVLTDGVMPGLSGIALLARIMAKEELRGIPVINSMSRHGGIEICTELCNRHGDQGTQVLPVLVYSLQCHSVRVFPLAVMSSHDSMEMVLKCFQRGAADFLVKPVRKNELKNLWQHVWRRCHSALWRVARKEQATFHVSPSPYPSSARVFLFSSQPLTSFKHMPPSLPTCFYPAKPAVVAPPTNPSPPSPLPIAVPQRHSLSPLSVPRAPV
ncbi:unnamed protein product [Closterium sp. Yama58-4]|nr:unnamed protein product [Closterium sp. Yama58-4]